MMALKDETIVGLHPPTAPQTERGFAAWRKANGR
jgi:hypothetical protein